MLPIWLRTGAWRRPVMRFLPRLASVVVALTATATHAQSVPEPGSQPPASLGSAWSAPEPWRTDRVYLQTSAATIHFNPSDEHVNHQELANLEYRFDSYWQTGQWIAGIALFKNSFGQPSQYVYGGWLVRPFATAQPLYFKITAGALQGYKPPYDNKIPFNDSGVAPAILPSVGYCYNRYCSEFVLFGAAGAMLTLGVTLP
jgi:hypothetical protein